jgi:hypothetical protein
MLAVITQFLLFQLERSFSQGCTDGVRKVELFACWSIEFQLPFINDFLSLFIRLDWMYSSVSPRSRPSVSPPHTTRFRKRFQEICLVSSLLVQHGFPHSSATNCDNWSTLGRRVSLALTCIAYS